MEGPESFIIEIEASKVGNLIQEFKNDAEFLAQHLKIMNNRMVHLNPRFQGNPPEAKRPSHQQESTEAYQNQIGKMG